MLAVVTPGKYGGWGERNVRKPEAAKKKLNSWTLIIKGTEEGHKTGTGSPGQEAHHQ